MSNVVNLANKRDWKWHRDRIAAAWGKQIESIVETGQMLIEAKEELGHGSYEAMVQSHLPFGPRTAHRLKAIAENKTLSNRTHASVLPPSWMTLYELTRLDDETLRTKLKDGSINPKLERREVVQWRAQTTAGVVDRIRAIVANAKDGITAPQVRELLGNDKISPSTIRGVLSKLAKAGELVAVDDPTSKRAHIYRLGNDDDEPKQTTDKPKPPEPSAPPKADPQVQRDEMRRSYVTFLQTLAKEDQVEELGKIIRRELIGWSTKEISALLKITSFNIKLK